MDEQHDKARLRWLGILLFFAAVTSVASVELLRFVSPGNVRTAVGLVGHGLAAIAMGLTILLSYWWGASSRDKRGQYFGFLALGIALAFLVATSQLIHSATTDNLTFQWESTNAEMGCKIETSACRQYLTAPSDEKRADWNRLFFGQSGVNLDSLRAGKDPSISPSEEATAQWKSHRQMQQDKHDLYRNLAAIRKSAAFNFTWYVCTILVVLAIGGVIMSKRERSGRNVHQG
jgi:hypothetical protein